MLKSMTDNTFKLNDFNIISMNNIKNKKFYNFILLFLFIAYIHNFQSFKATEQLCINKFSKFNKKSKF